MLAPTGVASKVGRGAIKAIEAGRFLGMPEQFLLKSMSPFAREIAAQEIGSFAVRTPASLIKQIQKGDLNINELGTDAALNAMLGAGTAVGLRVIAKGLSRNKAKEVMGLVSKEGAAIENEIGQAVGSASTNLVGDIPTPALRAAGLKKSGDVGRSLTVPEMELSERASEELLSTNIDKWLASQKVKKGIDIVETINSEARSLRVDPHDLKLTVALVTKRRGIVGTGETVVTSEDVKIATQLMKEAKALGLKVDPSTYVAANRAMPGLTAKRPLMLPPSTGEYSGPASRIGGEAAALRLNAAETPGIEAPGVGGRGFVNPGIRSPRTIEMPETAGTPFPESKGLGLVPRELQLKEQISNLESELSSGRKVVEDLIGLQQKTRKADLAFVDRMTKKGKLSAFEKDMLEDAKKRLRSGEDLGLYGKQFEPVKKNLNSGGPKGLKISEFFVDDSGNIGVREITDPAKLKEIAPSTYVGGPPNMPKGKRLVEIVPGKYTSIIDKSGKPRPAYHGTLTNKSFYIFKDDPEEIKKLRWTFGEGRPIDQLIGPHFAQDHEVANRLTIPTVGDQPEWSNPRRGSLRRRNK